MKARNVVDYQADEGVVAMAFCAQSPTNSAIFVPPQAIDDPEGTFRKMAEDITAPRRATGQIHIVADPL